MALGLGSILGGVAAGATGAILGQGGSTNTNTSTSSNWIGDNFNDPLTGLAGSLLKPDAMPEYNIAGYDKYLEGMGGLMGTLGQGYMDTLSGKNDASQYQALQDLQKASAATAGQALGGELNAIGLGAAGSGTANSSRRGVAEGVATANANTQLSQLQAQQNQQFLKDLQAQKAGAMQGLSGLSKHMQDMLGIEQNAVNQKYMQELMKKNPAFAQLLMFQTAAGGLSGITNTTTNTQESSGSGLLGGLF